MEPVAVALVLVLLVAVVYEVAGRIGIPYPVLLVLGGLAVGFLPSAPRFSLQPDLVLLVFLPPLLFAAALETPLRDIKVDIGPIIRLSIGLVLFTTVVVAAVARVVAPELAWPVALTLGAIVSPTDVLAATTVFRRLSVPQRIVTILEGEGLLNDATALILYRSAVLAAVGGGFVLADSVSGFAVSVVGGVVTGGVVGAIGVTILRRLTNPPVEVAIMLAIPFAAYLPAEQLHLSGVLAAVTAGFIIGRRLGTILTADSRLLALSTWQMVGFILNGLAFLLIGLELPHVLVSLGDRPPFDVIGLVAAVSASVIGARLAWIVASSFLPGSPRRAIALADSSAVAWRLTFLAGWSGLRGVVSLAAALALPEDFPERNLVLLVTFGVILVTLVGQGLTLPLVVRWLGLAGSEPEDVEEREARRESHRVGLAEVERLRPLWPTHGPLLDRLKSAFDDREGHLATDDRDESEARLAEHRDHEAIQRAVIAVQRRTLIELRDSGAINDQVLRTLERELDYEELRMEV